MSEKRELPKGWVWAKIGEICHVQKGRTPRLEWYSQTGIRIIKFRDLTPNGINWESSGSRGFVPADRGSRLTNIEMGMTLIGADAHNPEYIGKKVCFVKNIPQNPTLYSGELMGFKPKNESALIAEWPFFWLSSIDGYNAIQTEVVGVHLNSGPAKKIPIPIPPLAEQKRIAGLLARQMAAVEKARNAAEEKLAAARLLPSALLRDALGNGEKRELPKGWVWAKIGEVCDLIFGQSPPSAHYKTIPEGLPFFQGKADFGGMHPTARIWCDKPLRRALPGDILISIRAPVGPTNVADVECCIGRGLAALRSKAEVLDKTFLLFYLKSAETEIAEKGSGSTFSAIGKDTLRSHPILLPPLAEQKRIAELLARQMAASEKARNAAESELREIRVLPAALLRQTLVGGL